MGKAARPPSPLSLSQAHAAARGADEDSRLRLITSVRLRWFAILGQLVAIATIYVGFGFDLPVGTCLMLVALSAWLNVFLRLRFSSRHRLSPTLATSLLGYDILQLGALLHLTGGIENPFTVLIVAPVIVSAATLSARSTLFLGTLALAVTSALVVFHLPLPWHAGAVLQLPMLYKLSILAAIFVAMTFMALYAWRLSKEARLMSQALAATELIMAREQRLHALDGLAAAAAHELGTPLATIALVTREMERDLPAGSPLTDDVQLLRSQSQRCREILQKLTRRPDEQDPMHAYLTVSQLIEEAARPHAAGPTPIVIRNQPDPGFQGSEPLAERRPGVIYGLGNLIENAVDFSGLKVEIEARWSAREVAITIRDDGPGFPPEIMDDLGEPYVTTRRGGTHANGAEASGLGLGFFIAKSLLERSGAEIRLDNREPPQRGAIVEVVWPMEAFVADLGTGWRPPNVPAPLPISGA